MLLPSNQPVVHGGCQWRGGRGGGGEESEKPQAKGTAEKSWREKQSGEKASTARWASRAIVHG